MRHATYRFNGEECEAGGQTLQAHRWRRDVLTDAARRCQVLAAARERRDDAWKRLAAGVDPSVAKRIAKRTARPAASKTFEAVAHGWMNERKTVVEIGQYEKTLARLESDVFPWLGGVR